MALFGDKNSPKTQQTQQSSTKNTQINPSVTAGANSNVGGAVVLSDLSGVSDLSISTTDQGAVNAGLKTALAALDTVNSNSEAALTTAGNVNSDLAGITSTAIQGQQNTSLKYLIIGVGILAAAAVAYAYFTKR